MADVIIAKDGKRWHRQDYILHLEQENKELKNQLNETEMANGVSFDNYQKLKAENEELDNMIDAEHTMSEKLIRENERLKDLLSMADAIIQEYETETGAEVSRLAEYYDKFKALEK